MGEKERRERERNNILDFNKMINPTVIQIEKMIRWLKIH